MNLFFHRWGSVGAAFVRSIPRIVRQPSVFVEKERKSALRRYCENVYLRFRDGGVCGSYNAMGLDIVGHSLSDFVSDTEWLRRIRGDLERRSGGYNLIFLDKYLFYEYLRYHDVAVVPVFAHTIAGGVYLQDKLVSVDTLVEHCLILSSFFVKKADDMCGRQMMKVDTIGNAFKSNGGVVDLVSVLQDKEVRYILQPVVANHEDIRKINPSTLNTVRITTYRDPDGVIQLWNGGTIRIGRKGGTVDNYAQGGICVGINDDGTLRDFGFCHDDQYNFIKVSEHPDSGIAFKGFELPYYRESVSLVKRAHELFPTIKSVGWDVAITQEGPVLLEGNHDWDLEFLEVTHSIGYRKKFDEVFG